MVAILALPACSQVEWVRYRDELSPMSRERALERLGAIHAQVVTTGSTGRIVDVSASGFTIALSHFGETPADAQADAARRVVALQSDAEVHTYQAHPMDEARQQVPFSSISSITMQSSRGGPPPTSFILDTSAGTLVINAYATDDNAGLASALAGLCPRGRRVAHDHDVTIYCP
jgi:hypothetical protein